MNAMRQHAINYLETWIADELLSKAPTGEGEEAVFARFSSEALSAGLSHGEITQGLVDPDMANIVRKHRGEA